MPLPIAYGAVVVIPSPSMGMLVVDVAVAAGSAGSAGSAVIAAGMASPTSASTVGEIDDAESVFAATAGAGAGVVPGVSETAVVESVETGTPACAHAC